MPIKLIDSGQDNTVLIDGGSNNNSNATIIINGNNNVVVIEEGCVLKEAVFRIGSNCSVNIGRNGLLNKLEIYCLESASITIGEKISCTWYTRIYAHEPAKIVIGNDCLIASEVVISASDMHTIFEVSTGRRVNQAEDITIGRHVWLAANVSVMKGVNIGENSVVGANSLVTKDIPSHCVAAGSPAKVIKTGTNWRPDLI